MPSWLGAFNLPSTWTATVERGQGEGNPCGHQQPWGCDGQQVSTWSLLVGRTVLVQWFRPNGHTWSGAGRSLMLAKRIVRSNWLGPAEGSRS